MAERTNPLDHLVPDDPLMAAAWASALRWGLNEPDILDAFREATGNTFEPGKTGLEQAIDSATGADAAFIKAFAEWFTAYVWGDLEGGADE